MENQNNHRRIPALGIVVDSVSVPRAIEISQKFFYNDYFNFVLFAGSWLALESQTSDEIRKFISEADLILPGDHNIEKVAEQESEESFQALYLDGLLSALAQMEGHVCVLCETEQIEEDIVNNILEDYIEENTTEKEGVNVGQISAFIINQYTAFSGAPNGKKNLKTIPIVEI